MSHSTKLTLRVHVPAAPSHAIGGEIWPVGLAEAIAEEAEAIANLADAKLFAGPSGICRDELRIRVIAEMTDALVVAGDTSTAPDGVIYSLTARPQLGLAPEQIRSPL